MQGPAIESDKNTGYHSGEPYEATSDQSNMYFYLNPIEKYRPH